jgi:proline iminopeptidase
MKKTLLIALTASGLFACKDPDNSSKPSIAATDAVTYEIKTGGNRMIEIDGKYHVWTKKVGNGKIKVLLLHGGPGVPHDYMECFEDFLPKEGMEIYYYDQLGCGNSDKPSDTTLWNLPRFVEEVEQVRKGLHLDSFYIVGHSWGGMLAMEYLHKYQTHVKGAVLSNMTAGMKDYTSYTAQLKKQFFTERDIKVYDSLDKLKKYNAPQYTDLLMNKLYTQVLCQLPVEKWPEPLLRSFNKMNAVIYQQMQGVDEFHVTGNFKDWEFWDRLPAIKIPVLVLGGMKDEMNPEGLKKEGQLLPNSRTYLCPNGAHMAMYDDQQNYFNNLTGFFKEVDNGYFKADKK